MITCQMQLREALEAIAEKEETIDDMERKVRLERHEKDELIRENQVTFTPVPPAQPSLSNLRLLVPHF